MISPAASERTVTVSAWVPALPPMPATIGINVASATSRAIVPSKWAMTKAPISAVNRLTTSQGKRFMLVCRAGTKVSSADTPPSLRMSSSASSSITSTTSSTVITPKQAAVAVDHGGGDQGVAVEGAGDVLLVGLGREGAQLLVLDVGQRHGAPAAQQAPERHVAHDLEARVDQEDVVEVVRQVGMGAQIVDGLADRPIFRDRHHLALHQAAGAPLREGQALLDRLAVRERQRFQDRLLLGLVEIGQDLDRVVGLELGQGLARRGWPQGGHHLVADELVEIGQGLGVESRAQRGDDARALVGGQPLQEIGEIGRVQRPGEPGGEVEIAGGDGVADLLDQGVGQRSRGATAVSVVDIGRFSQTLAPSRCANGCRARHRPAPCLRIATGLARGC